MEVKSNPRWLDRKAVLKRYKVSNRTIDRWVEKKLFPAPKVIGEATQRWDAENDLEAYDRDPEAWKAEHANT